VQLICEVIPNRQASTDELQALGRALVEWQQHVLPQRGLRGDVVSGALDDLLAGELPTPAGILIANAARSVLEQRNLDAAIRAYLMRLVERDWESVRLDREGLERRAICGVITLAGDGEDGVSGEPGLDAADAVGPAREPDGLLDETPGVGGGDMTADGERLPTPEEIRQAVQSLVDVLPRRAVHSVELKRLVPTGKNTLRERVQRWRRDSGFGGGAGEEDGA
jgi:hypothetical protein